MTLAVTAPIKSAELQTCAYLLEIGMQLTVAARLQVKRCAQLRVVYVIQLQQRMTFVAIMLKSVKILIRVLLLENGLQQPVAAQTQVKPIARQTLHAK